MTDNKELHAAMEELKERADALKPKSVDLDVEVDRLHKMFPGASRDDLEAKIVGALRQIQAFPRNK